MTKIIFEKVSDKNMRYLVRTSNSKTGWRTRMHDEPDMTFAAAKSYAKEVAYAIEAGVFKAKYIFVEPMDIF